MPASVHSAHSHKHGPHCDHPAVVHRRHIDHMHNGHLHHQGDGRVEEHVVAVDERNPDRCTPRHDCGGSDHDERHVHSGACGHLLVPHGDHFDHWVRDHLHHPHGDHCDDHGPLGRKPPASQTWKKPHGQVGRWPVWGKEAERSPPMHTTTSEDDL